MDGKSACARFRYTVVAELSLAATEI